MATDDCFEIGRGPCPCGKGIISVEKCVPDHPWAKESQASYTPALVCEACKSEYGFFAHDIISGKRRLVRRRELDRHTDAEKNWHSVLRNIEASPDFKELTKRLEARLALENSAAGRYRVLSAARVARTMSLGQYRKRGYRLSALEVSEAMAFTRFSPPGLQKMAKQADAFAADMHSEVRGIKTGIPGLEM